MTPEQIRQQAMEAVYEPDNIPSKKDLFIPVSHLDLLKIEFPALQWFVEGLIPSEAITIVSGNPETYKSWIVMDMVVKAVTEGSLFGRFPTQSTGCLVIDEENGLRLLQERSKALTKETALPIYYLSYAGVKINQEYIDKIITFCQEKKLDTVVFDSFVRFLDGADENSSSDVSLLFGLLKRMVKEKITVVLIHHHRKEGAIKSANGQEMRGSSDILAAINCHIIVEKKENQLLITPNKLREAMKLKPFLVNIEEKDGNVLFNYNQEFYENGEMSEGLQKMIIDLLAKNGEMIMDKICASLGGLAGITKVKANVRYLENIGSLESERGGTGGRKTFFIPLEKGENLPF